MTLAEAVETLKRYCHERGCEECLFCEVFILDGGEEINDCALDRDPENWKTPTETNIYDEEEIHENCTVQILRNSVTGEESVGWLENGKEPGK